MTPEQRFWSKVEMIPEHACWEWDSSPPGKRYGTFWYGGRMVRAHRMAWFVEHGTWPPGDMEVCHTCDNGFCVRPDHLFVSDHRGNMADMAAKGRNHGTRSQGETHGNAVLTAGQVRAIRRSDETLEALAERYGVGFGQIGKIKRGERWRHI